MKKHCLRSSAVTFEAIFQSKRVCNLPVSRTVKNMPIVPIIDSQSCLSHRLLLTCPNMIQPLSGFHLQPFRTSHFSPVLKKEWSGKNCTAGLQKPSRCTLLSCHWSYCSSHEVPIGVCRGDRPSGQPLLWKGIIAVPYYSKTGTCRLKKLKKK